MRSGGGAGGAGTYFVYVSDYGESYIYFEVFETIKYTTYRI